MEKIKLVIWDLDDTFWDGTLSEGKIRYIKKNHDIVITLAKRGIANTICSKNDYDKAREELQKHKIWEYFVFPKINWEPKGQQIAKTTDEMKLRSDNVLFIDDNETNLGEARYYNRNINTATPDILDSILKMPQLQGKDDGKLTRLKQYKILEKKTKDMQKFRSDNKEFLRASNIQVRLKKDCDNHKERILELIERTNQLNFTKKRIKKKELEKLLDDDKIKKGYLEVSDNYGDYGIAGFYAIKDDQAIHLLFSCRILGMGVEQWLYQKLGRPKINIDGSVSSDLFSDEQVDWINKATEKKRKKEMKKDLHILLKGGCDLALIKDYLMQYYKNIDTEFNYISKEGISINPNHMEIINRKHDYPKELVRKIPFIGEKPYKTKIFEDCDFIIYSLLRDYNQGLYMHKEEGLIIPYYDNQIDMTKELESKAKKIGLKDGKRFFRWFSKNFMFIGKMDKKRLEKNMHEMIQKIPKKTQIIFLNAATYDSWKGPEKVKAKEYQKLNRTVSKIVDGHPNTHLVDISKIAKERDDFIDSIRHYKRGVYIKIAKEIMQIINKKQHRNENLWYRHLALIKFHIKLTLISMKRKIKMIKR